MDTQNIEINIKLLQDYINKNNEYKLPNSIEMFAKALGDKSPLRIRRHIAFHYITLLCSQFKIYISTGDADLIPLNSISFIFAPSGIGKDSTCDKARNIVYDSFKVLYDLNIDFLNDIPKDKRNKFPFIDIINEVGISTDEGLINFIDKLNQFPFGTGSIYTGEFIHEFSSNGNIDPILKSQAEMYDRGNKLCKKLKDDTKQNKSLRNTSLSSLFMSPITYNTKHISKLKSEFISRYARRSTITFISNYDIPNIIEGDIENYLLDKYNNNQESNKYYDLVKDRLLQKTLYILDNKNNPFFRNNNNIILSKEANLIFIAHRDIDDLNRYKINDNNQIEYLHKSCSSLRTLKFAGCLSLFNNDENFGTITKKNYLEAYNIIKYFEEDIVKLEYFMNKQDYHILVDLVKSKIFDHEIQIKYSELCDIGIIKSTNNIKKYIDELIIMCNNIHENYQYSYDNNGIIIKKLSSTKYKISYKLLDNIPKDQRHTIVNNGFENIECTFDDLIHLCNKDTAYLGYHLKDGNRNKNSLINASNVIILDVDKTDLDINTMHDILKEKYNHIVSTTSDNTNLFKYRIILPIDQTISIDCKYWKIFLVSICNDLNIPPCDFLTQCQIYYGYKDSKILYSKNKKNYSVINTLNDVEIKKRKDKNKIIHNIDTNDTPLAFVDHLRNSANGERNNNLIRACNILIKDRQYPKEVVYATIRELNETYTPPLTELELGKYIYPHIEKNHGIN